MGDLKNIAALPLRVEVKKHLISAKVIPQLTYGAAITKIPQRILRKTQNEIVNVIWANRPHWRARLLVLGIVAKPHRVEPLTARAYTTVVDFVRFLNQMPTAIQPCLDLQRATLWPQESLIRQIADALGQLGLTLQPGLGVSFRGSSPAPLFAFNHRDITKPLQYLASRNAILRLPNLRRKTFRNVRIFLTPTFLPCFYGILA